MRACKRTKICQHINMSNPSSPSNVGKYREKVFCLCLLVQVNTSKKIDRSKWTGKKVRMQLSGRGKKKIKRMPAQPLVQNTLLFCLFLAQEDE